jgi:16S rRNA (guanine966-N2)-methyltransferase
MSALDPVLPGARVLELYAGTGAVGLEALSRGASRCDFVENNPAALHALKANVAATRCRDRVRIFKRDALHFLESLEPPPYDLAIADPPYGSRQLDRLIESWLREPFARILSVEHAWDHHLPPGYDFLDFGETRVTTYRVSDSH